MKRVLKILAAVLLVVGSFGGGVAFEKSVDKTAMESAMHIAYTKEYTDRVWDVCKREGIIFVFHQEHFDMYFQCIYVGNEDPENQPLI